MVDHVQLTVPLPQVAAGHVGAGRGVGHDERVRPHDPGLAVDRLGQLDPPDVVGPVLHVRHGEPVAGRRVRVLDDARVRRLRGPRAAVGVRQGDAGVVEREPVGRRRPARRGVLAVEVQEHLVRRVVPQDVGRRDVRDALVERQPLVRDDRVVRVLRPRALERVGVHDRDAARGVVRGVVEVPLPQRVVEVRARVEDAREDELVRRVVEHRLLVGDHAAVLEHGQVGRGRAVGRRSGRRPGRGGGRGRGRRSRGEGCRGDDRPGGEDRRQGGDRRRHGARSAAWCCCSGSHRGPPSVPRRRRRRRRAPRRDVGWWQCRRRGAGQVKGMMRIISVLTVRRAATLESSRPHLNVGHQTY